jgi:outer membrane autotransporter protein
VTLASGGGTVQTLADTTLSGSITGPGALVKSGNATLTLTGPLSYSGGTAVNAGTLAATTPITGSLTVANAAVLNASVNVSNTTLPGGTALGPATAVVAPGGTINGNLTVASDGGLINNGLINGMLNDSGVLIGNGTFNGSLNVGGLVAPGNSIGTMRINGSINFAPGAIYQVQIGAPGQSDLITASGRTIINGGTVQVVPSTGFVPGFGSYTILTAQNGVSGQFATVQGPFGNNYYPFLAATLAYDANDVYAVIGRSTVSFASAGQTANQVAAGGGADQLSASSSLLQSLALLNIDTAPAALNNIAGDIYASTLTTLHQQSVFLRNTINLRLHQASLPSSMAAAEGPGGPASAPLTPESAATVWQQGYGSWGQTVGDGNASSLHRGIGGYFIGVDHGFGNWRAGLATGISQSNFNTDGNTSQGSSTNYDLAVYGGGRFGAFSVNVGGGYIWHNASVSRFVAFPGFVDSDNGKFNAGTGQVFTELAYDQPIGAVMLQPFAGLAYVNAHTGTFAESGGAARLNGSSNSLANGYTNVGLRAGTPVTIGPVALTAHGMLGLQHAFGNVDPQATLAFAAGSGTFTVTGAPIARDALLAGAGVDYQVSSAVSFGVRYFGQISGTAVDNTVDGHLLIRF